MTSHRMVVETGPGSVRRLCCGTQPPDDGHADVALDGIDDPVVLVDEQPVAVSVLWASVLRSLVCPGGQPESVLVIHPTWWSAARIDLVTVAARTLADDVVTQPRAQALAAGATVVVVEIAAQLVAITTSETVAEPRTGPPDLVTEAVAQRLRAVTGEDTSAVLIDGPAGIGGGAALAEMIAEKVEGQLVDDTWLARETPPAPAEERVTTARPRFRRVPALVAGILVVTAVMMLLSRHQDLASQDAGVPTTFLIEGRVALQVPSQWPVRRVTNGPGSARVEVVSSSDPEVMLHVTQSPALPAAADALKEAIAQANTEAAANVFVDFNAAGDSAGRPAVTYREVRPGHHIDWTVLVDGPVRISIGCQHRPGAPEPIRDVCDQAVRSARTVNKNGTKSAPTRSN